jgi:putative RNA 2'-phosphotransferase
MLSPKQQVQLSKFLSLILRHQPDKFGLKLDEEGFVPLADLLRVVRREKGWGYVTEEHVREVVANSDKQRFEIVGERIRARYGHSVPQRVIHPEVEPPEVLYHGTAPRSLPAIREQGLQPMKRQYVHLSTRVEQAQQVGRRHGPQPVVLTVRARSAWQAGVKFYQPEERLYLSTAIPAEFIEEK